MAQKKRFYQMGAEELLWMKQQKLIKNTAFVYLALKLEHPFNDGKPVKIQVKDFSEKWEISVSSLYEAIARLKATGAVEIHNKEITVSWVDSQQAPFSGNSESILGIQNKFREVRTNSGNSESSLYIDSLDYSHSLEGEGSEKPESEEEEEPAQEVIAEVSIPNESEKSDSREKQNLGEDKFSAPARDALSQRFDTRALHLLKQPIFLHWWANRVEKTKFGSQELEMPPMAYVKARIRKNPESALDMWEAFQDEMGHRVDNYQLRVENGCVISPEEQEAIATIAPYTPTPVIALSAAAEVPRLPSAPSGENAGAYRAYKPESVEVAPPPSSLSEELAKIKAKMSMPKTKPQATLSRLERLRRDLQDPIMRPEIVRIIQNSDELNLVFDENGNPIDVIEEAW
jgi:hypothetical protein